MVSNTAAVRPSLARDETGTLLCQTTGLVAVTVGAFADSPAPLTSIFLDALNVFLLPLSIFGRKIHPVAGGARANSGINFTAAGGECEFG